MKTNEINNLKDFDDFMKSFLTKSSKTNLGVPKRPTKKQLGTTHKIVKNKNGYNMIEVD